MKEGVKQNGKKAIIVLTTICVLVLVVGLVAGCNKDKGGDKILTSNKVGEIYAMSAVTGVSLLSSTQAQNVENTADQELPLSRPDSITDSDIIRVKEYLEMFKGMLLGGNYAPDISKPDENDGEYKDYGTKISVTLPSVNGGEDIFVIYYNETASQTQIKDDNETEVETTLEGIVIFNNTVYPIEGRKEVENEDGEIETEVTFKAYRNESKSSYIMIEQEIESNEVEYVYTLFEDGKMMQKTKVEFENDEEENEQEIKISFLDKASTEQKHTSFQLEKAKKGQDTFNVKYKADSRTEKFSVRIIDNEYVLTYRNGFVETIR